jgi:transposase-like protein
VLDQAARQPQPLGLDHQKALRRLECQARSRAGALTRWAQARGIPADLVAHRIGVARQTLEHWEQLRRERQLHDCPRGRPPQPVEPGLEDLVNEVLQECRGHLGLPTLKDLFPCVPRTTLKAWRTQYRQQHDPTMEHLTWTSPGTVWAADYTPVPAPIDGCYPFILCIRDLASAQHLLAWPVPQATAQITLRALRYLFALYGPPLVLKTDNGSPFTADLVRDLLALCHVAHLRSPPLTPRYNGAQEASIGSIKSRALHLATAAGRFDIWTCDDIEAARLEANTQGRPFGRFGLTPEQRWSQRTPILPPQRTSFLQAVAAATSAVQQNFLRSLSPRPESPTTLPLNATQRATVTRRAIRRTLVERGYLVARRTAN